MFLTKSIISFLLLGLVHASVSSYPCRMIHGYCYLTGIKVSKENPEFTITHDSEHLIEAVQIENSALPVLTNVVCDQFPDIFTLNLKISGVENIALDALKSCKALKGFQSWDNPIKSLDENLFQHSLKLRHLAITNSSLTELPKDIFENLKELTHLFLPNNHLSYDNPKAFKGLENLEELQLHSNELLDLDPHAFLMYLPKLKKISLNDNDFFCGRLVQIIDEFKRKGIEVDSVVKTKRSRTVGTSTVEGNICIASQEDYTRIIETKKGMIPQVSAHHQFS